MKNQNLSPLLRQRMRGLNHMISRTPMLEIKLKYKGEDRTIYAKAEYLSFTGSTKDRMAFHILQKSYKEGLIKPEAQIYEATSGNTGIAFAAIGRALGHKVTIYMPDWMSEERKQLIRSFGADIRLVSKEEGGFIGSIALADKQGEITPNSFLPHQFSNDHNTEAHYITTGPEIIRQLAKSNLSPDAFVAGVGTGGTIMGVGAYLKEFSSNIKVHPLEPASSPTLTTGYKVGSHRIQGISDEFIPAIVELDKIDDIVTVDDGDAIIMAQKLAQQLGIGVGISSGANLIGAIIAQNAQHKDATVVTVFADDNKKYLSTDLMREEPVKDGFYSSDIELLSFDTIEICEKDKNPHWEF